MTVPPTLPRVRLHVGEAAVIAVASAAARAVPGVVAAAADLGPTDLRVTIATRLGDNCRDLAAAVQQAVTLTIGEQTGLDVQVRVTVAEILLD